MEGKGLAQHHARNRETIITKVKEKKTEEYFFLK
jgi:hypothetical protein